MEQLHLTVYFEPDKRLEPLHDTVWTYDFDNDRKAFFMDVESRDSFQVPVNLLKPLGFDMAFEEV